MSQIYASHSKEEMEKIWTSYVDESRVTVRKVGIRVKIKLNSKTLKARTYVFDSYEEADSKRKLILDFDSKRNEPLLNAPKAKGKGTLSERKSKRGPNFCECYLNSKMPGRQDILVHFDDEPVLDDFKLSWHELLEKENIKGKYIVFEPLLDEIIKPIVKLTGNHSVHNEIL
jgi:hypothetical protein